VGSLGSVRDVAKSRSAIKLSHISLFCFPVQMAAQQLPDLRKGCVPRNFTQVEFYISRNFPKFISISFFHAKEKIKKQLCFEKYNKSIKTTPSSCFDVLAGASIYFILDAQIRFLYYFNFAPAGKNYVKSNLRESLIT